MPYMHYKYNVFEVFMFVILGLNEWLTIIFIIYKSEYIIKSNYIFRSFEKQLIR
jgi:hypothetical protein